MSEHTKVEKDWVTKSGLRAVVLFVRGSHRCGYVGVDKSSSLYGASYNSLYENGVDIEVHGGLTFSDEGKEYPVKSDLWWFGFDCAHSGDATSTFNYPGDVMRSLEYCIRECESMAEQLSKAVYETKDSKIIRLQRQRDELVEALKKYGDHRPTCTYYPDDPDSIDPLANQCNCGFDKAIASLEGV